MTPEPAAAPEPAAPEPAPPEEEAGAAGGGAGEGACEVPAARLLALISAAIRGRDLETLKPGLVRAEVERACGLEAGSLDVRKGEINQLIVEEAQRCIEADTPEKGSHKKSGRKRQREDPGAGDAKRARSSGVSGGPTHGPATAAQTDFLCSTAPLRVQVADAVVEAPPRVFASGACGFYSSSRVKIEVNGEMRQAMCQVNLVVLDSRLEEERGACGSHARFTHSCLHGRGGPRSELRGAPRGGGETGRRSDAPAGPSELQPAGALWCVVPRAARGEQPSAWGCARLPLRPGIQDA